MGVPAAFVLHVFSEVFYRTSDRPSDILAHSCVRFAFIESSLKDRRVLAEGLRSYNRSQKKEAQALDRFVLQNCPFTCFAYLAG